MFSLSLQHENTVIVKRDKKAVKTSRKQTDKNFLCLPRHFLEVIKSNTFAEIFLDLLLFL